MRRLVVLLAAGFLCLAAAACGDDEESGPLTIMPIGDNLTEGNQGFHTYRCYLDQMLTGAGVAFDLVGSESAPLAGDSYGCPVEFDQDHEAEWGSTIGGRRVHALESVEQMQPDVALVHLGTGDLYIKTPEEAADDLASFVVDMQRVSPTITVLVAQVIPCYLPRQLCSDGIVELNDEIASFAELSTDDSRVMVVDMHTGFTQDHMRDVLLPNDAGDELIATRWLAALQEVGALEGTPVSPATISSS